MTALWYQEYWWVPWAVVLLTALMAGASDLKCWRIPNAVTFPLFLGGLAWSSWSMRWVGLGESILGVMVMGLPFLLLYALAGGGAGDAKMMMGMGAWLGPLGAVIGLVAVTFTGLIVALVYAVKRRHARQMMRNLGAAALGAVGVARRQMNPDNASTLMPVEQQMLPMPYGVAIALGMALATGGVYLWRM